MHQGARHLKIEVEDRSRRSRTQLALVGHGNAGSVRAPVPARRRTGATDCTSRRKTVQGRRRAQVGRELRGRAVGEPVEGDGERRVRRVVVHERRVRREDRQARLKPEIPMERRARGKVEESVGGGAASTKTGDWRRVARRRPITHSACES